MISSLIGRGGRDLGDVVGGVVETPPRLTAPPGVNEGTFIVGVTAVSEADFTDLSEEGAEPPTAAGRTSSPGTNSCFSGAWIDLGVPH